MNPYERLRGGINRIYGPIDHILHIFKDSGLVVKMFMKSISRILDQESLTDLDYYQAMTIFYLTVLVMDILEDNGNGQMANHGTSLIGTTVNQKMKDQMTV